METSDKRIDIIASTDKILISSCIGCVLFKHDATGYKHCLLLGISDEQLGCHIQEALKQSRLIAFEEYDQYLNADELTKAQNDLLAWWKESFKKPNYKSLVRDTIYCSLEQRGDLLKILSYQRVQGENLGDEAPKNWTEIPVDSTAEALGRTVKLALTKCGGSGTEQIHKKLKELGWE